MCIYSNFDAEKWTTEKLLKKKTLILLQFKALSQGKARYVQKTEHQPYIRITESKQVVVKSLNKAI